MAQLAGEPGVVKPDAGDGRGWDEPFRQDLADLLRWRRDVRRFRTDPLDRGVVDELLRLAALAPSVGHAQPWRFVLVDNPGRRAAVVASFERENDAAAAGYDGEQGATYRALKLAGLREAPVQVAVFCDEDTPVGSGLGRRTMPETLRYSVVCAIHTLWLAARARGIALGWVSILDPDAVAAALDVPRTWSLVGYLCLGWPERETLTPELDERGWEPRRDCVIVQR